MYLKGAQKMEELEKKLGYSFTDNSLLETALSHSSYANENKSESNERLEFLGDSVLGQVVARHLFLTYPKMPEGQMTKLRAELVCEQALFSVARKLELGRYIKLGKGEEHTGGRERGSILADAVEAVLAAMYLDGGMEAAERFINAFVLADLSVMESAPSTDYKTALQERIQRRPGQSLAYETVSESGPDHNKTFTVKVLLNGDAIGTGKGHTKKEAEQYAAKNGLEEMSR